MSSKSRTLEHFAQTAGVGDVLCHPNGAHIYTADCDGHIRVFSHSPLIQHIGPHSKQLDQQQPRHHTAAIHAIAFNSAGTRIASASADRTVKLHDTTASPTATSITIDRAEELYSSDKSVPLCVQWLPTGNDVVVGSDDGVVRVVSTLAGTARQYRAHQTAVCSVAVSSDGQCLASIDKHGMLVVWDVESRAALLEEQAVPRHEIATQLEKQPKVQLVSFSPSTQLLATPARSGSIALRSADRKWKVEHELSERGSTETPTVLAWSSAGGYLLAVSRSRCIVWQVADGELSGSAVIAQLALGAEEVVLSAVWSTRDNSVLMMRDDGWMKKWNDVVPAHLPQPFSDTPHAADTDADEAVDTAQLRPVGDVDDDEDEDGEEIAGRPAGGADGKEEADGQHRRRLRRAGDAVVSGAAATDVAEVEFDDDDMNDFIVDDTDGLYRDTEDDYLSKKARASLTSSTHTQPPFQPASTPPDPTTRRRYLAYNLTGSVVSTPPSDHAPFHSIEIVFADSATHRTQRLKDHYGFSLSALGEHGCVMAKVWESSQRPSVVFYRELAAWTANSDWTVHLPSPETAVCVAVTNKCVAVATDRQWVRLLSFSGRQCAVVSMPGPVITMVGGRDQLCVVYAAGVPLPNNQLLHARVVDPQRSTVTMDVPLPLSPGATLTWLGYSDKGGLLSMDSSGVLRLLSMQWGGQWLAILDVNKKQTKDVYWPVGLIDDKLMCAVLKAGSGQKVPSTLSRPVLTAVQVELPFVVTDSHHVEQPHARAELMMYEAQYTAHVTSASANSSASRLQPFAFQPSVKEQASLDKLLLPVIQLAIKADQGSRALDLTSQLYLLRSMESALLLAQTNRKVHLASRISLLIGERRRQEEEEKDRKRAAVLGAAAAGGRAISVTEYINKADKRVTDERKRRIEQQKQDEVATTSHKAAVPTAADDQQSDAGDEGESELTYSKNGKKRVKLIERTEVMADRADSARQESDEKEEEQRRRDERERRDREQMVVEDDGITTEQQQHTASSGVDFLTRFRKQKEKEKKDKEEAEERQRDKEKEKKKKAKAAASKQNKAKGVVGEDKVDRAAESEKENNGSGGRSDGAEGGQEVVESDKESVKVSESGKEADASSGSGVGLSGLRKSVNPFAKRVST